MGLLLLMIVFSASAAGRSGKPRELWCGNMEEIDVCPQDYNPVCGTDGVTYSNKCSLCRSRPYNPALMIAKDGPCNSDKTVS